MNRQSVRSGLSLLALLLTSCSIASKPEWNRPGWTLVWHDEFDQTDINRENWAFDIGGDGWGNQELEYYTDRLENARIENGTLILEARKEDYGGRHYTSARLKTQGLHSWAYGRMEARVLLPSGQGIWSAFWMAGANFDEVEWPRAGEIDIMESLGSDPTSIYGTIHGPGHAGKGIGGMYTASDGVLTDDYHTFAIEWAPGKIEWFIDDEMYFAVTSENIGGEWVYDHPFFLILNLAVGGIWPGSPDETTSFPQQLRVDYVRVYQRDPSHQ